MSLLFSHELMSNSLGPCGLYHARLLCPPLSPRVCLNSCHWVDNAIQPSHPLARPSPFVFNLSQHFSSLFQWVGSSYQVAKVLELQHQSFQWTFRVDFFRIDWFDLLALQATHEKRKSGPREHTHTGRMPCEDRGRDLGDAKEQAKECQRLPANHQTTKNT